MSIKVLGGRNLPGYWERFNRLQQTADKLRGKSNLAHGVYRFSSFEEFEKWKEEIDLARSDHPTKQT